MSVNNSPTGQQGVQQKDGGPIFVMQSMSAGSHPHGTNHLHERYMSNESLENDRNSTTSSTESPNSSGNQHRKDHEFIPTRSKTITASRPAADPSQFTKVPSNPLLISAQKQLMQAEEIRKRKESEKMVRRGDDEPDWQNELGAWKTRRRKQSEDAFQRVAEVKALEDDGTGEPRKLSIGKKLSSLLYTNPEDDWSDFNLDNVEDEDTPDQSNPAHSSSYALNVTEQKMLLQKNNSNRIKSQYNTSVSPSTINEDEEEFLQRIEQRENNMNQDLNNTSSTMYDLGPKVQNWTSVIQNDAPKRTISSPMVTYTQKEADNSIGSANGDNAPQVRRKSSELSASMKTRLEAFNSSTQASGVPEIERFEQPQKPSVEPDKTFHNKLQAFRKISMGQLNQEEVERKPKPPMTISSLLGGGTNANRSDNSLINPGLNVDRNNEEYENDTLDDVDQLLDDALEESYRSVLETDQSSHSSMSNPSSMVIPGNDIKNQNEEDPNLVFSDNDFVVHKNVKSPPSEKPPPVPPTIDSHSSNMDEELDKQEQAIIASLEMEEREHKRYMETQEKMRRMPTPSSGLSETKKLSGQLAQISNSISSNDKIMTSSTSSQSSSKKLSDLKPNNATNPPGTNNKYNNAQQQPKPGEPQNQIQAKKRSQQQEQKSYNQHWLIQEAEQRRLAGGSAKPPNGVSPSIAQHNTMNVNPQQHNNGIHSSMQMMTSPVSHGEIPTSPNNIHANSPVYENSSYVNHQQHNQLQNNMYTNHQRIAPSPNDNNWQNAGVQNMGYSQAPHNTNLNHQNYPIQNENVYANLGSQPPLGPDLPNQDNSSLNYEREGLIPGPQVPPRNPQETSPGSNGDRVLSVSGKKRCSHCKEELGRGAAMIIESLRLFYHLRCFQCCVCQVQLGNGAMGTDVRVRNNKLHCQNCYSNDEGLKFSKV